ncbi:MAG: C25 family cysteine peptidase, partial [Candidatus Cloacimonetes bacterium]|nr:C25 family cysteine peptidase [Candidatus Cloacimonadota bacterium]
MKRMFLLVTLLLALGMALNAEQVTVGNQPNQIRLTQSGTDHIMLELTLGQFNAEPVSINGATWHELSLKKEGITLDAAYPSLPILARSVIIPNTARMQLSLVESEYVELQLPVAPSKGNLTRDINPADVPYSFGEIYFGNEPWPAETAYLTEPYILRDYRGITVRFQPFVYYPDTQTLRVYTKLSVAIDANGTDLTNSLPVTKTAYAKEFAGIYKNMFLNFNQAKYPSLDEAGRILAIKHSMFDAAMQPWVDWKRQNGYQVDVVDVTVAGPTSTQIKNYIQAQYDLDDGLMFVQIFGDAPQVPSLTSGGGGSDPSFALLAGADNYPDIYVGRFSAQTEAELQTQVQRTIYYERDVQTGSDWAQRGVGIASNEGGGSQGDMGESDQQHIENIRTDLLNYGYLSVDQLYQATGATATQVSTNVNAGRGIINYCGHGSTTSWGTTGFSNTHVNALTNDYMLPFIVSVACVNGNFVSQTCFAEAWLRATNNNTGDPTGAVGMYASSINQSWNPPMRGQDEVTDLLVAEDKQTLGGLLFNGSSKMIEVYGANGFSEYKCWHIFGDASLMVRSKDPQPLTATYNPVLFLGMSSFMVETEPEARVTLSAGGTVYATGIADASGTIVLSMANPPLQPMDLNLTITAFNKVTHLGTVQVLPASGPYLIVTDMTVSDDNNNIPEFGEIITINVSLDNVGTDAATGVNVSLSTDDDYLTLLSDSETIADIAASSSGGTVSGFSLLVAENVPDQHVAQLQIVATTGSETFEYSRNITLSAPTFSWSGIIIEDFLGNNNGMIDPGESVTLKFPYTNTGHAQANEITTAMVIDGAMNVSEPVQTSCAALPAGGDSHIEYFVT